LALLRSCAYLSQASYRTRCPTSGEGAAPYVSITFLPWCHSGREGVDPQWITALLGNSGSEETLVVAFRGTLTPMDMLVDTLCSSEEVSEGDVAFVAHRGMLNALMLRPFVAELVTHIQEASRAHPSAKWVVCGHSLGGGLAILASVFCPLLRSAQVVTFGAPLVVGKEGAAKLLGRRVTNVVNGADIVPRALGPDSAALVGVAPQYGLAGARLLHLTPKGLFQAEDSGHRDAVLRFPVTPWLPQLFADHEINAYLAKLESIP